MSQGPLAWRGFDRDLRAHARALRNHRGVHAVFARPVRGGHGVVLMVHCEHEPAGGLAMLAKRGQVGGYAVRIHLCDVPSAHLVDSGDEVWASDGPRPRDSTVTGLVRAGGTLWVVASGHATLPYGANGCISTSYDADTSGPAPITINDGSGGFFRCQLMCGAFAGGRSRDFALLRIRNATDDMYDGWHAAAGRAPPWRMRSEPLARDVQVWHVSRFARRPQRVLGRVTRMSVSSVDVRVSDGTRRTYTDVIAVEASGADEFSIPGESGSLVVDDAQRVVGTVIAGAGSTSYVLPASSLARSLERKGLTGFLEEEE